jgi:hypothetical protein
VSEFDEERVVCQEAHERLNVTAASEASSSNTCSLALVKTIHIERQSLFCCKIRKRTRWIAHLCSKLLGFIISRIMESMSVHTLACSTQLYVRTHLSSFCWLPTM